MASKLGLLVALARLTSPNARRMKQILPNLRRSVMARNRIRSSTDLSRHRRHSDAEKDEQKSTDAIHGSLRSLDESPDARPIQGVDEEQPERGADQHHAEDQQKRGARRGLGSDDRRKDAEIKKRALGVEEIVDESLNEPWGVGPPIFALLRVECRGAGSKAGDSQVDEVQSRCKLERGKRHDALRDEQPDTEHAVGDVNQIPGEN